jgi:AGZA family xanthine/uracil permease-like MFS transporter
MESVLSSVRSLDSKISKSTFGRVFRLDGSGHVSFTSLRVSITDVPQPKERKGSKFVTEIRAGLTTFFTMAYIIAVNVGAELHNALTSANLEGFRSHLIWRYLRLH